MPGLIAPHGGALIDTLVSRPRAAELAAEAAALPRIGLSPKQSCDLEMITIGAFSPLNGFMGAEDFESVCRTMKLASGRTWSIPILLSVNKDRAPGVGQRVAL